MGKVLGVNKGATTFGKVLRDGGSALMVDGQIVATLAEERVTRLKKDGGFTESARRILAVAGLTLDDLDAIAVSTCCEPEHAAHFGHEFEGRHNVVSVNHHKSHASLAFCGSGYARALVVVMDGGGNVLTDNASERWWLHPREQVSYYLGTRGGDLTLIGRDFDEPQAVGFGELYRAFAYYLGWPSSRHASRVMALSGHGRRGAFVGQIYDLVDGRLCCPCLNEPDDPVSMVRGLSRTLALDFGEPRGPNDEILQVHADVAAFVQEQLESAVLRKLRWLKTRVDFDHICLSGGVALNVLVNGKLTAEGLARGVYVPPAPADDGQALGNAIVISLQRGDDLTRTKLIASHHAALGPDSKVDSAAVSNALLQNNVGTYIVFENASLPKTIASLLSTGSMVILFEGASEFGPRALGHRSIVADPRRADVPARLNIVKCRDSFMPFAPAVLRRYESVWFDRDVSSPFMSFAAKLRRQFRSRVPAVQNYDGTARLQTLESSDPSLLRQVVDEFERRTGVPLVLNTSFNLGGEPIVETVDDAVRTFKEMAINAMALGRFLVVKKLTPHLVECDVLPATHTIATTVVANGHRSSVPTEVTQSREVVRWVQQMTGAVVFVRHDFPLYERYLEWLRQGRKVTTIRYRPNGVEIPREAELALFKTRDYGPGDRHKPTGRVRVKSIRYQRFGELTAEDARRDGFSSLEDMRNNFQEIYPKLQSTDWITLYEIHLVSGSSEDTERPPRGNANGQRTVTSGAWTDREPMTEPTPRRLMNRLAVAGQGVVQLLLGQSRR